MGRPLPPRPLGLQTTRTALAFLRRVRAADRTMYAGLVKALKRYQAREWDTSRVAHTAETLLRAHPDLLKEWAAFLPPV